MNNKYLVATVKPWNISAYNKYAPRLNGQWHLVTEPVLLKNELLNDLKPRFIFFPHWSWIVSSEIHKNFPCVVFHMTDLPFGRGGSPLQNLISRGIYRTKVSALRMTDEVDSGPIYMKHDLDISTGSATEIFEQVSDIIFTNMIPEIIGNRIDLEDQSGDITYFKRLNFDSGNFNKELPNSLDKAYDLIRMLDAEGYPRAFVTVGGLKIELQGVNKHGDNMLKGEFIIHLNQDVGKSGSS